MAVCPRGHESDLDDYCDVCGAAIGGLPTPGPPRPAVDTSAGARPGATPPRTGPSVCPECGTPMNGRFCERCGFDALAVPAPPSDPDPTGRAPEAPSLPPPPPPPPPLPSPPAPPAPAATGDDGAGPRGHGVPAGTWHAVVSADRAYFDRIRTEHGVDPEVNYPWFCPDRRFSLAAAQVLIGRHSRSRGIFPDIDLTGPPEDTAVSHLHALLVAQPDGSWSVVDLRSANRTYVNDGAEPIPPETPVLLRDGDHIHVGAWTRITLRTGPLPH